MAEVGVKSPQSSALDQSKQPDPTSHEQEPPQFAPQGPSGQPFPPPNFAFYTYPPSHPPPPPPADGTNPDPNAPPAGNAEPLPYPPGMYPYVYHQPPPPGYMPVSMSGMPIPSSIIKPKRKQVKMACTNCAAACKRCDVSRPCERCIKYGLTDSCHDGVRKERKKGFKRGPYNKRKRQDEKEATEWDAAAAQNNPNAEWTPGAAPPPFPPQAPFPPPPEGYYPAFYALGPPPPGPGPQLIAVPHNGTHGEHPEGQPDGTVDPNQPNGENGQPPHGQPPFPPHPQFVYPHLPPGAYPHFGYPFPGPPPPHPPPSQQQPPQVPQQQQLPTLPQGQLVEDTRARPQQDQQDQTGQNQNQSQSQTQEDPQQPSPNNSADNNNDTHNATKKKRASAVAAEEIVKEDDDEDEDLPTPPKKKRGRRPFDGDWSATSKKKTNGAARGRRSARRSQAQPAQEEDHTAELQLEADNAQITEVITDQDIVGSSENPGGAHS